VRGVIKKITCFLKKPEIKKKFMVVIMGNLRDSLESRAGDPEKTRVQFYSDSV